MVPKGVHCPRAHQFTSLFQVLAAMAVFLFANVSAAEDLGARFSLVRLGEAAACPDAQMIEHEVGRRLRRDPFVVEPVTQTIEGLVQRTAAGVWVADLYSRGPGGELVGSRKLTSDAPDCASLAAAVALAVALAIDPEAALTPPPPEETAPETGEDAEVEPTPEPVAPVAPVEPTLPTEPAARLQLGASVASGLVPGFAPGLELAVDARLFGALRITAGMLFIPERQTDAPDASFGFGLTAPWLGLCLATFNERFSLSGCATVSLGALHAIVYEPRPLDPGDHLFVAASVSVQGSIVLVGPLFVAASLRGTLSFIRHRFRVDGRESVEFQQDTFAPSIAISLGVRFP